MSEGLRKKLIYATLPLALIWAAFNMSGKKDASTSPEPLATTTPDTATSVARAVHPVKDLEYHKDVPWGRDPFGTSTTSPPAAPSRPSGAEKLAWVLAGIVFSNQQPMALINSHMVKVGDRISGATVVEITKDSVTLEDQGRRIKLTVSKG